MIKSEFKGILVYLFKKPMSILNIEKSEKITDKNGFFEMNHSILV